MKLVVGLGNTGEKYKNTRHNIGFKVIDEIAKNPEILAVTATELDFKYSKKYNADLCQSRLNGSKFILCKPQTFMNNSGISIRGLRDFYHLKTTDIWIICDDVDLPLGVIRVRNAGSSGGHKGLQSIIEQLGTNEFIRVRVGIQSKQGENMPDRVGKSFKMDTETFVLERFTTREEKLIKNAVEEAAQIIIKSLKNNQIIDHTYKIK